ncbi:hypothetical protein BV22DRAFT_642176 [Leucogyrophana mollusca]|uniref:Uncharacterized protein n=1 Tax=Leucogyrophana mollusca TaxID=85980 RepID=A0ACB8BBI4_9AGAM|nr:hypothetical protein BV22DRAFT_642176 [Leucogyrophana mollusca]
MICFPDLRASSLECPAERGHLAGIFTPKRKPASHLSVTIDIIYPNLYSGNHSASHLVWSPSPATCFRRCLLPSSRQLPPHPCFLFPPRFHGALPNAFPNRIFPPHSTCLGGA